MPGIAGRLGVGDGDRLSLLRRFRHRPPTGRQHILDCGDELRQKVRATECVAAPPAYRRHRIGEPLAVQRAPAITAAIIRNASGTTVSNSKGSAMS
jgi:hypothetical protein